MKIPILKINAMGGKTFVDNLLKLLINEHLSLFLL